MEILVLPLIESQNLADGMTDYIMSTIYGKRYNDVENVEDDTTMNKDWERLNEGIRNAISTVNPFRIFIPDHSNILEFVAESSIIRYAQEGYSQWKKYEEQINGKTFEEAYKELQGINNDGTLFDVNRDDSIINATVDNKNGKAVLNKRCEVWPVPDFPLSFFLEINY